MKQVQKMCMKYDDEAIYYREVLKIARLTLAVKFSSSMMVLELTETWYIGGSQKKWRYS